MKRDLSASFVLLLFSLAAWSAQAAQWTVDYESSEVGFTATWEGIDFDGVFRDWRSEIRFDPRSPGDGEIKTTVDVSSVDTQSADRDEGMGDRDWFDFERFPRAYFHATGFRALGPGRFEGDATLRIKGAERSLRFPFTWVSQDGGAWLRARLELSRTDFGIGAGEWADDELVGLTVPVRIDVRLLP